MNPLLQAQLASAIRWLIAFAMAALAKDGVDKSTLTGFQALLNPESIASAIGSLIPLLWGLWQKHRQNTSLVVAAATGTTTAVATKASSAAVSAALPAVPVGTPPISKPL